MSELNQNDPVGEGGAQELGKIPFGVILVSQNSIAHTLGELNQYDPIGEGGAQEGGDETSVHREKAAS